MDETQATWDAKAQASIHQTLRDSLFSDPYLLDTAEALPLPDHMAMAWNDVGELVFFLKEAYFMDWMHRHQVSIGTNFHRHNKPHTYSQDVLRGSGEIKTRRAGHSVTRYDCQRKGEKRQKRGVIPGGKSGKTRVRGQSNPCRCPSYFRATLQPNTNIGDGKVANLYRIEYRLDHNHRLGDDDSVGTLHKSKAIRDRIKAMLLRGMSISAIMGQLTMDHAKFTRLLATGGNNSRLARDDFVTYDDVYNIYYAITAKQMRKDKDPATSARLWMEDLHSQGYFTYYDQEHGLYHGFSSPWQLNELTKWGNVFCFDGTHHACG